MQGDRGSSEREADAHDHRQRHRDEAGVNGYLARERQETDYTRNADVGGARESGKDRYGDEVGGSVGATRKMTLVAEKETTRTTDAETTETKHGTMGVKRERDTLLRTVSRTQSHTHTYGYGHYVLNILRSTLTCLIQTGESCCLRFVGDSRADVIRVHAFLPRARRGRVVA